MSNQPSDSDYTTLRDSLPRLWWNLYQGSLAQGFDSYQAFVLLQTYILSNGSGVQHPKGNGPKADDGSAE